MGIDTASRWPFHCSHPLPQRFCDYLQRTLNPARRSFCPRLADRALHPTLELLAPVAALTAKGGEWSEADIQSLTRAQSRHTDFEKLLVSCCRRASSSRSD